MKSRYLHVKVPNLQVPTKIIDEILKHFSPKKVIDLGCWLWLFVKVFQDKWIDAVWVDGDWTKNEKVIIKEDSFIVKNLEEYCNFDKKYDLAVSLEVAEHLNEKSADIFVKTLVSCSDYIIFSAAIPWQWWQNHINEQSPTYWEEKFNKEWYKFYDVFRHVFWSDEDIFWWYKQNIFLVAKDWVKIPTTLVERCPRFIVHPELYNEKNIDNISMIQLIKIFIYRLIKGIGKILSKNEKSM